MREQLTTSDSLEAVVSNPAMPTEGLSENEICDICGARMTPVRQLELEEGTSTIMGCTSDPSHTKNVLL